MHGLFLLWWVQEKQIPAAIVAAVLAAGDLALIGLELPTGWFADRFGHRASLIIGSFVQVIGMLWCWHGEGVSGVVTACVLVAVGDGFRSGADQALLYRSCVALGREADFQRIEARAEATALVALAGLVILGGVIVHASGFALGWLAETALCFLGLMIACAMVEPPARSRRTGEHAEATGSVPVRWCRLAVLILPAALLGGTASAASFLAQTTGTNTPASVSLLVAALAAAEAAGCAAASRLPPATARVPVLLAAAGTLLLTSCLVVPATLPLNALALAFLFGLAQPLRAAAIQRLAEDGIRARAASAASAGDMAVSTVFLLFAGAWRGRRRA